MLAILLTLAAIGHVILWVAFVNRLHAVGIWRMWIHVLTAFCGAALVGAPLGIAYTTLWLRDASGMAASFAWAITASYLVACAVVCIVVVAQWCCLKFHPERRGVVLANHTSCARPAKDSTVPLAAPGLSAWLASLPLNQALDICVQEKQLAIPRLSRGHDGLRIAHLSDLHMSGRIAKEYFHRVVDHVNRCQPDIVAITGDLVERDKCIAWIADTLGRLRAPGGVYYVLGNHDQHVDQRRLHDELAKAGLVYLGGTWRAVTIRDIPLVLAGNELPWYRPAAELSDCPPHNADGLPLRVLLSHSPDQFEWAQQHEVDLMLAGHNHGGQIRLPLVGAILAPSRYGVRYAGGAYRGGNTVMHVCRGTSSLMPVRINCPPEIALLILRCGGAA
jgi:predicted MPP superfamily phosphohydrolase